MKQNDRSTGALLPPLPEEVIIQMLTYLKVPTLIKMKQVSRTWQQHCINVIDAKRTFETQKVFMGTKELRGAVKRYRLVNKNPKYAEVWAKTYGYPIGKWDVSHITDFSRVFFSQREFNEDINDWDVSNATTMRSMFQWTPKFNKPLSKWNTSKVISMSEMFNGSCTFNQSLTNWDTSHVTCMRRMFQDATNFNQPLYHFNTSQVTNMLGMFIDAKTFNQNISNWDTSNVTNMIAMFLRAETFHQNLSNWDTSQVIKNSQITKNKKAHDMFRNATSFQQNHIPISLDILEVGLLIEEEEEEE